jgi:23S rRNA pseudouridine1911/1915/1917 synthase
VNSPTRQLIVPKGTSPRLDAFLAHAVPGLSLDRARSLLRQGLVRVNGKLAKPTRRLWGGETVALELGAPAAMPKVEGPALPVLYQDPELLIIDKPRDLIVDERGEPLTVVTLLASQQSGFDVGGVALPGVAHRLDRDTTGCLALARTDGGLAALQRAFLEKRVEKRYAALVLGQPAEQASLDTPYARDPRDPRRYTTRIESPRRARLSYRVRERFGAVALLEIELDTGRTHQIRAQLADVGLSLLGDPIYGTDASRAHPAALALGRVALHAESLRLDGVAAQPIAVTAPLPDDFRRALAAARQSALG